MMSMHVQTKAVFRPTRCPNWPSDEKLLVSYCERRDDDAFSELVRRYERPLRSHLRRYVGDPSLADDLVQLTFLQVHKKCHTFQQGRRFRPWLYAIATHQAIDLLRKKQRDRAISLDASKARTASTRALTDTLECAGPGPVAQLETREHQEQIRKAVKQLPRDQRVVLKLIYFRGKPYREVANLLHVPVGTVKTRVHSALAKLRPTASPF